MSKMGFLEKAKHPIRDESEKDRAQAHEDDPTNPAGTIRHDRQSVAWLVEPAWKAIVTLLWVAPDRRLSLSLSLSVAAPPSRSRK